MMIGCYNSNNLHSSARKGILNLIPKPNKDARYVKNLRPITLLNTDYKIIEKAIANKMIPALEHIIHTDQRGFMKDRRISVNIRKMLDIIHEAKKEDLEAVVMSLDFVKCFDKCSFSILHGSLEYFEFGKYVKEWTQILYKDFSVRVQNNGNFSQEIPIEKGVHQGGCCSSIYFLVIAEILAISLRKNQDIEGITIHDIRNLLNQFADDLDIFSLCTEKSISAIYQELEFFRLQSGFTVSYEKTTLYRIGSLRHSDAQMYNMAQFAWSNKDINVLGVTISHEDIIEKNYLGIINKVKTTLNAWHNRGLSLMGKMQVVNTLVASLFVYKMMVLPTIPQNIIKNVDNIIRDFIWNGKKSKIAYKVLQNPKSEGGLNLVSLGKKDIALKATWPKILYSEKDYGHLVYNIIGCKTIMEDIWRCSFLSQDVKDMNIENNFWVDVLKSWGDFNFYKNRRVENQYIWLNSHIKVAGKMILWEKAYCMGLKYVHQLFENGGFISYEQACSNYKLTTMEFNSLKTAMPKEWKDFFSRTEKATYMPIPPHNFDMYTCAQCTSLSQDAYKFQQDDVMLIHNKYLQWVSDLGSDFCEGICDYGKLHLEIYKVTNITKFRSFQYRVLHRALVTNIHLAKWNIVTTENCTFCGKDRETIVHLLCDCEKVKSLWQKVGEFIRSMFPSLNFHISAQNIITNHLTPIRGHAINFICLLTKQFIYRQRCAKESLTFTVLKNYVERMKNIEKYIAIKNNKMRVYNKKWLANDSTINQLGIFVNEYCENM